MWECWKPLFGDGLLISSGNSYLWKLELNSLHITSNSLIALFNYSIFILLVYFVNQWRELPYPRFFTIFGIFTIVSGTTDLMNSWTIWHPDNLQVEGIIDAIALLVAILCILFLSKIFRKPRPTSAKTVNSALIPKIWFGDAWKEQEIPEPNPAEVRPVKTELEQRINEQIAVLQRNNQQLKNKIEGSERKSEELRLLQLLTQLISEAPDFHSALCVTLRQVCELTDWDYGEAWLPCADNKTLECSPAWYGNTTKLERFRQVSETLIFEPNIGLPGRVWTSRQSEWIEDISTESAAVAVRPQAQMAGLKAGFAVPILIGDQVLAVLTFFFSQSRATDQRWVELVTAVAMQLGLVMQRKLLEEELRQERDFSQTLVETSSAFFVAIDANGKTMMMNQCFLNALGYTLDEVIGTDYVSTFVAEADRESFTKILEQLVKSKQSTVMENCVLTKDNWELLVEWRRRAIFNKNGGLDFFFGVGIDITERRLSEKESARLASIALLSPNPIVETDLTGNVRYLNPEAMQLFPDLQDTGELHPFLAGVSSIVSVLQSEGSLRRDVKIGEIYYEQVLHYVAEIECLRIYAFDITDRKQAEEQLIHNAFYDQLTGLANRALFMDRLRQTVRWAKQNRKYKSRSKPYLFAVLFLNLNRFKLVNDSLGNRIGDQLLQCFARRLQTCICPTDTVARLGGDEFAILLEGIQDVSDAIRVAEAINQILMTPFYLDGCEIFMTISIGIALNTSSNNKPENLLRDADIAMYSAKAKGQSRYEVFDAILHEVAIDKLQIESDLRRAIERQEFRVYYQPIVSLYTGRINGFEALIRWQHPQRGLVYPTEFIPTAEETGLITAIGWWTLQEACRQLKVWQQQFPATKPLTMNVNLSCKQFTQNNLLEQIDTVLQQNQLSVGSLKLEITESVVMENPDLVRDILLELKKREIHLCIDDFGTGYSSLSRLHHFPISTLKIDRSFVSRIGALGENSEIVQAIVTLAQTLSMDVVAEGIEVSEQVSPLIALQCEYGQGYFFSKPVDSEAAAELLMTEWRKRGR